MTAYRETVCLILRHTPFQESSLIVSGISPDAGRLDFLLKGARGLGKKKFPPSCFLFNFVVPFPELLTFL